MGNKIKTILISQPKPVTEKSPYFDLADKHKLKIDFRSFIHVEGVDGQEFRQERISLADFGNVIFTSRVAVDNYFRMAKELRYDVPDDTKYFCISESTAFYLQKYIVYRKRKIFYGNLRFPELLPMIKKYKKGTFLLPCADILKDSIPIALDEAGINYSKAVMYNTVCSDLSDLEDVKYDMLVFFSPSGIESLYKNFPGFTQNGTLISVFGPTTRKAAEEKGLRIDVAAPNPKAPSMTMAIENHILGKS
jgi:uroporphyrinogen-III synthase